MNSSVLITGATGFIGRHCVEYFSKSGFHVYGTYHNQNPIASIPVDWVQTNILDENKIKNLFASIKPDYLIQCAWYVEHALFWQSPLNIPYIDATVNCWREFNNNGGRKAIFLGTCAESLENPSTTYGISKRVCAERIEALRVQNKMDATYLWARIFGIYGPYEDSRRILPYIINSYLENKTPILKKPSYFYDFIYVKNLALIFKSLLHSQINGIVDVGQGTTLSIFELAEIIQKKFFCEAQAPILEHDNHESKYFIPNLTQMNSLNITGQMMDLNSSIDEYIQFLKNGN